MHNTMVIQDLVKHYGLKSACLFKLDLHKAYDTIDWTFLRKMLTHLGFLGAFSSLECITNPKFSLLINGSMQGFFSYVRGLRQGDLMSPLLTLCCVSGIFI